jgi:hypothetical protein
VDTHSDTDADLNMRYCSKCDNKFYLILYHFDVYNVALLLQMPAMPYLSLISSFIPYFALPFHTLLHPRFIISSLTFTSSCTSHFFSSSPFTPLLSFLLSIPPLFSSPLLSSPLLSSPLLSYLLSFPPLFSPFPSPQAQQKSQIALVSIKPVPPH